MQHSDQGRLAADQGTRRDLRALRDANLARIRTRYPDIPHRVSGYNLDALLASRVSLVDNPAGMRLVSPMPAVGTHWRHPATARAERIRQATAGTEHEHDPFSSAGHQRQTAPCSLPTSSIEIAAKIRWMDMRHRQDR
ncbi:hypothetical protein ABZ801_33270 [Actinomadura sp. NPDC047616]|uniref:hypothetical protein n=1 Tax=Actinomadura sp. NPDC047616 TaxID=3155914 RepID=UPI0033E55883